MDKTARNKSRLLCSCVEPVKRLIVSANELIKKLSYPLLTIKQRQVKYPKETKSLHTRLHMAHATLKRPKS